MTARNKKFCVATEKALSPLGNETGSEQAGNNVNVTINLRKIPLLAQLTVSEMTKVKKELQVKRYARREVIIKKRASGNSLLFLLSGRLQAIDMTDEGRVIGLQLLSAGEFFGETTLINQSLHTSSVIALSDVLVAFLSRTTALHLFAHSPSVATQIQKHLAQKVHLDYKFRAMLSINNTAKRISSFLVLMKQKTVGEQELVENLPTHQEIASMINTSRETVTRTLLTLTHQGIIRKDARRLIIVRPKALQEMTKSL
jgi:CRP/FNR family transcriptional regulator, cyclic AMP receptor protein